MSALHEATSVNLIIVVRVLWIILGFWGVTLVLHLLGCTAYVI